MLKRMSRWVCIEIDPIGLRFCGFGTIEPSGTIGNHREPPRTKPNQTKEEPGVGPRSNRIKLSRIS